MAFRPSSDDWPHGQMISLARKPPEPMPIDAPVTQERPVEYPYGCCISFDDETLAALGLDGEMPSPGDVIELYVTAKVTCASQDAVTGKRRVELQITEMLPHEEESAVEDAMEESAARRKRFYGDSMQDYDRDVASYNGNRDAGPRP